ncbi:MAG TPA: 2-hydroxyacyl-CoA dehydratase family protein, partial [Clostridia bacterium]
MISNLNDKAAIKKVDSPEYAVLRVKSNQSSNLNADYFYNLATNYSYQSKFGRQGHISIMGLNIPEEMIYAVGAVPVWTLGGSPEMAALADKYVARDTDAVSKSSLGLILSAMSSASRNADL